MATSHVAFPFEKYPYILRYQRQFLMEPLSETIKSIHTHYFSLPFFFPFFLSPFYFLTMNPKDWIDTSSFHFELNHFVIPQHYQNDLESILIPNGLIMDRIEKLAKLILEESNGPLVVCCILKGGYQFFSDLIHLMKKINLTLPKSIPLRFEFIKVKSYENDYSTGSIDISLIDITSLKDQHLLIVEDIIDTGNTMVQLLEKLKTSQPKSIRVASLLLKKTIRSNGYIPDYVGFLIPDKFVVGYGLDYNEYFRDLNHICVINEHGKKVYTILK
jgi:hypoxanthine phosphoribosyltransferase